MIALPSQYSDKSGHPLVLKTVCDTEYPLSRSPEVIKLLPEHKIYPAINVKMQAIVGILIFMSRINFVLSLVEHEKSFITSRPDHVVDSLFHNVVYIFLKNSLL